MNKITKNTIYGLLGICIILFMGMASATSNWTQSSLGNGLVAYYSLDEDAGTNFQNNATPYDNNGTGNATGIAGGSGKLGFGGSFDGNKYVGMSNFIRPTSAFTITAWINLTGTTKIQYMIVGGDDVAGTGGTRSFYFEIIESTDKLEGCIVDNCTTSNDTISKNAWNFVTMVYNGTHITVYINKDPKGSLLQGTENSGTGIAIGAFSDDTTAAFENDYKFVGYIDEVGIWNRTLSASEISDLYNNGTGLAYGQSSPPSPPNVTTFENVNITNNLTVGNNFTASNGFFTNLGLAISRIVKGWFTDIDVSGTTNLTGPTYLLNTSCSLGQVLTTNASGFVSCVTDATGSYPATNKTTANISTTVTTVYNTTIFMTPMSANKNYTIECRFDTYTSSSAVGVQYNISVPNGFRIFRGAWQQPQTRVATNFTNCMSTTLSSCVGAPTAGLVAGLPAYFDGYFELTTAGNLNVSMKAEAAGTVTTGKGSWCRLTDVNQGTA